MEVKTQYRPPRGLVLLVQHKCSMVYHSRLSFRDISSRAGPVDLFMAARALGGGTVLCLMGPAASVVAMIRAHGLGWYDVGLIGPWLSLCSWCDSLEQGVYLTRLAMGCFRGRGNQGWIMAGLGHQPGCSCDSGLLLVQTPEGEVSISGLQQWSRMMVGKDG